MNALREAAQRALEAWNTGDLRVLGPAMGALRAALAQEQDAELSAALGWPGGISDPVLDRTQLLQMMAALRLAAQQALEACEQRLPLKGQAAIMDELNVLRAALAQEQAEPVQEPVAWYFEARHIDSAWGAAVSLKHPGPEGVYTRNVKPLYTAPPRCPNCASLEAQNDELDRKLAKMEQAEPVQEPVAWMWEETAQRSSTGIGGIDRKLLFCRPADEPWKRNITPLYTAPPRRTMVPLTEEEIDAEWHELDGEVSTMFMRVLRKFARAIERAHGIGETK